MLIDEDNEDNSGFEDWELYGNAEHLCNTPALGALVIRKPSTAAHTFMPKMNCVSYTAIPVIYMHFHV